MKIAVTGATGFIGSALVAHLKLKGHEVICLQRKSISTADERFFDMRSPASIPDLSGIDALVHTAFIKYDRKNLPDSDQFNIRTTLALEKACHKAGVHFIFFSTMSAHKGALSHYGRHKYQLEQQLDSSKDLILKLGLVIGRQGLFHTIKTAVAGGHVVPLVGNGAQPIQTLAVTDLCRIVEEAAKQKLCGKYALGTTQVYTLRELYAAIAARLGRRPVFLPVPYALVDLALSSIEALNVPFNVSKENLLGLKQLIAFDTASDLQQMGVEIMDMNQSLDELLK